MTWWFLLYLILAVLLVVWAALVGVVLWLLRLLGRLDDKELY